MRRSQTVRHLQEVINKSQDTQKKKRLLLLQVIKQININQQHFS